MPVRPSPASVRGANLISRGDYPRQLYLIVYMSAAQASAAGGRTPPVKDTPSAPPDMEFIEHCVHDTMRTQQPEHPLPLPGGPCPKTKATTFLFVNSKRGETPRQSRQSLRSHVMQQARSKRKWSTSKGAINSPEPPASRRGSSSRSTEHVLATLSTSEKAGTLDAVPVSDDTITPSLSLRRRESVVQSQTQMDPPLSGISTLASSPQTPSEHSSFSSDYFLLDPYASLPVKLDAFSRGMLDQCEYGRSFSPDMCLFIPPICPLEWTCCSVLFIISASS